MEDFLGMIIFLIFLAFSVGGKLLKRRETQDSESRQQPRWPGPVAGPGVPGYPQPNWPPAPRPQAPPPQAPRQRQRQPELGEGLPGGEGYGSGTEGPGSASTEEEISRFDRETDRFTARLKRSADKLGNLEQSEAAEVTAGRSGVMVHALDAAANRQGMAQAVVMAEILGEPKGLRRFPRRKR